MAGETDNRSVGITFLIAGIGCAISLGITLGPVFIPAGAGLAIVGLVYLRKAKEEGGE